MAITISFYHTLFSTTAAAAALQSASAVDSGSSPTGVTRDEPGGACSPGPGPAARASAGAPAVTATAAS